MLAENFKTEISGACRVLFDEPMKKHTTFKIGGCADAFCMVQNKDELSQVIKVCRREKVPYMIVGNGSNMLVGDGGIRGAVIKLTGDFCKISVSDTNVYAGGGVLLSSLCSELLRNELSGLEFAGGIPGSVGGGVYMNAGAYDGMLSDRIVYVEFIDENGDIHKLNNKDLDFGYRHSYFSGKSHIIIGCEFRLERGRRESVSALMKEYGRRRSEKQPLEMPSAGSTFKRPEGYFAGKLIQDSGLMGFRIGGAEVSEKHAGFVVNAGGATARDVLMLIEHIKKTVYDKFGVMLEEEVRVIGEK